jgi:hypothetical protein
MREPEASPTDSYVLKPGIAWYVGNQQHDNDIVVPPPPAPYICLPSADAVRRAWYAAAIGIMCDDDREITVLYYVDPETKHLYAQPHPDTRESSHQEWGIVEPRRLLPFELARDTARWIFSVSRSGTDRQCRRPEVNLMDWWRGYMTAPMPAEPPIPLGLPVDPSDAYRSQGWKDVQDWLTRREGIVQAEGTVRPPGVPRGPLAGS